MLRVEYQEFMKKLELIYMYHETYGLNPKAVAYILGNEERVIESYCTYLLEQEYIKKYMELHIICEKGGVQGGIQDE